MDIMERLYCIAFAFRDDVIKSLWLSIKRMTSKADIIVCVYCRPLTQDYGMDDLFYRQLGKLSGSVALVLLDFNCPDLNWEYHTAVTSKSGKFLRQGEDNFLSLLLSSEPTRKGVLVDLFENMKGLVGDIILGDCLGFRNHEIVEFKFFGVRRKKGKQS